MCQPRECWYKEIVLNRVYVNQLSLDYSHIMYQNKQVYPKRGAYNFKTWWFIFVDLCFIQPCRLGSFDTSLRPDLTSGERRYKEKHQVAPTHDRESPPNSTTTGGRDVYYEYRGRESSELGRNLGEDSTIGIKPFFFRLQNYYLTQRNT